MVSLKLPKKVCFVFIVLLCLTLLAHDEKSDEKKESFCLKQFKNFKDV
jgi:hypothetical protein